MKYLVLLPQGYDTSMRRYPVLYLLHGLTGDYKDWSTRTNLAEYSKTIPVIIVMPDAGNSWYTNAADGTSKFEDYIATELPADVVQKYRTINSRHGRAIAGLSMGGYGALKLALKRPAQFSVVGSFSGAFEVTREGQLERLIGAAESDRLRQIFGPADSPTRKENDVFTLAAALRPAGAPYIYIDCGTSDVLVASNRQIIEALEQVRRGIRVPRSRWRPLVGLLGPPGARVSDGADEEDGEPVNCRHTTASWPCACFPEG